MSAEPGSPTRALAELAATTRFADLPPDAIRDAERAVLDWLGSALAGSIEPPARQVQGVVASLGRSDEATVFSGGRASAAGAALANGVSSHILELDDVHKGSTLHPAAPIIPAALAVAERNHRTGPEFIVAVTLGYEVGLRIGEAVNPSHYRFWHPTGTAATFGAAAAAGSLLRLDAGPMRWALGTAGTQAAGLWEFNADGSMSKHLHPGKAAMNGVLAADLAAAGFTGAGRILEGERGFFRAMSLEYDPDRVTDGLGRGWKVSENCFKLHSCCGHTHSAIDLALDLHRTNRWTRVDALEQIAAISIDTYQSGYEIVKNANPKTPYEAKFSLAYCVAVAFLEGQVGLAQFSSDRFGASGPRDSVIAGLLSRTQIAVAPDLTAKYPRAWPARLVVEFTDGTTAESAADFPRGNPENPVSTADLESKFSALVDPRFEPGLASRALERARAVTAAPDVATLFRDFSGRIASAA